ncbi:DUF3558 domain-containing protein [Nonomuraea basaltis]|uniref:DUF3558 domain-containing protein n=1 Tax=Nonomuraea basaltis TaxID=2495887 RepID=UPI00110C62C5|nr:DUF3558 domain-containing protein [Nonomuraea basaltis]TMR88053.1 DUF3558 domain-containing protein [Nonomuraea basaltis]
MIRIVVAVFLLLTAACSADPEPPRPTQAANPLPSGPGRFAGILDPCSLLSVEQVEQLVTLAEQEYDDGGCTWSTPSLDLEGQAIYQLEVGVHLAADLAAAHAFFTKPPDSAFPRMVVKALPETPTSAKVGDESFILPAELSQTTVLAFRLSNAVININYGWHAKPDPRHLDQAQKAAQRIAEALDRPAPAVNRSDGRFAAPPYACSLLPEGVPLSATQCGGLKVRHARAWQGKSGVTVAKEIFAHYRRQADEPIKPVKGLGDEAFSEKYGSRVTVWVRVSNLVLQIPFNQEDGKVTPQMREQVAEVLNRLPAH